ncbi:MAG: HEAT repeat domain-containing protein [Planctomycetes bacterium]|nr:HEAT repeat domain-containing protein [Planctomycetota bacterium]
MVLLVLAGGSGGIWWYWQSTAIDRKVCQLVYEAAGYPDTRTERILKRMKLDFLFGEKSKPRESVIIREELKTIGHAATPALISLMNDENDKVRCTVVQFSWVGDDRMIELLLQALQKDSDRDVRMHSATILGSLGEKRAIDPLIFALQNDKDAAVRETAIFVLSRLDGKRAVEPLMHVLQNDQNCWVRYWASAFLGELGDPQAIIALEKAMQKDEHPDVRGKCEEAIAKLKSAAMRPGQAATKPEGEK